MLSFLKIDTFNQSFILALGFLSEDFTARVTIMQMLNVQTLIQFGPIFYLLGHKSDGFHRRKMHQEYL